MRGHRMKSFTLIELIMVIMVVAVLAAIAGSFFVPMMDMLFYVPSQTSVEFTANELMKILIDGDAQAKGLYDAAAVTAATAMRVDFTTEDGDAVYYRWNSGNDKIYRSINAGVEALIPYHYAGNSYVEGRDTASIIFTYYDASNNAITSPVAAPGDIEWIRMDLTILTGTGKAKKQHGSLDVSTAVDVRAY